MEESGRVVIRSFRLVFDRGYRRLFKIDRYRLPFAYGLPILGIGYAAGVAFAVVLAAKLPVVGPARVLLRYPSRGWQRGRRLHVEQTSDEPLFVGTEVTVRDGEELVFEGGRG